MKKNVISILFLFMLSLPVFAENQVMNQQESVIGFWKTINENTLVAESVIAIYPYHGQYFGRIILTYYKDGTVQDTIYNPKKRTEGIVGNPYYVGLDILWELKPKGKKYCDGTILDPEKGCVYGADAWRKGESLIVRGKWLIFGRNQVWQPATEADFPKGFQKPDLTAFIPFIHKI